MERMKWVMSCVLVISLVLIGTVNGQNFETGDNSTVIGCSSHCSYKDSDLTCWNKTLEFFEHLLLAHMRHYVSVQMNLDQWSRRHQKPYKPDFDGMKERSISKLLSYLREDDVISEPTVKTVITELMAQVAERSDHLISWTPHYSCPIPCEYKHNVWMTLFVLSIIVNLCLLAAVLPYILRMIRVRRGDALL